ncbi:hypothetical protein NLM16_36445 [Bradyrhizobium brasilense]|uniref:hypothetical protein n=1 Tax=Bradyrhizobium brasilense TaxID=1419277 RepID=UPI002877EF84|nr:hypothetical protein [Bradyrhizobium brasilense]MCP3419610.1 hypothetical protein [Bradyrhizobium brasilense]
MGVFHGTWVTRNPKGHQEAIVERFAVELFVACWRVPLRCRVSLEGAAQIATAVVTRPTVFTNFVAITPRDRRSARPKFRVEHASITIFETEDLCLQLVARGAKTTDLPPLKVDHRRAAAQAYPPCPDDGHTTSLWAMQAHLVIRRTKVDSRGSCDTPAGTSGI